MLASNLEAVAVALETAAGATTSANPTEAGRWKRIAAAAETLAGASTSANDTLYGYISRAAIALESIAGTSGAEENRSQAGYYKRIVDALEVQSGAVEEGSLARRMVLGAQNAVFTSLGDEIWPQPAFDSDVGLTFGGTAPPVVAAGKLSFQATESDFASCTTSLAPASGLYQYTITIDSMILGFDLRHDTGVSLVAFNSAGTFSGDVTLNNAHGNIGLFDDIDRSNAVIDSFSLKPYV